MSLLENMDFRSLSYVSSLVRAVHRKGGDASSWQCVSSRFLPGLFLAPAFILNSTANVVERSAKKEQRLSVL